MKMKRIANNVALQTIGYVISGFTNVYIYVRECGYHIHFWMVMLGYGADRLAPPVQCQLFREYDYDACNEPLFTLDKLRDHRKYSFCVIHGEEGTEICIFDKDTLWEVARF